MNSRFYFLYFIPALLLSYDFLPLWFIGLYTSVLILLSILKIPTYFAYLNFISCYFIFKTVAPRVIPETMVPLLAVFIISKLITDRKLTVKKNTTYDHYLPFLWLGGFAIFSSNLYFLVYTIFFISSVIIPKDSKIDILSLSSIISSFKNIFATLIRYFSQIVLAVLFVTLLFLFFPRIHGFLPSANMSSNAKIGYSKTINNSNSGNLQKSNQTAFYAELDHYIPQEFLYWRGRIHSHTDGYNWYPGKPPFQKTTFKKTTFKNFNINDKDIIIQKIKFEQDMNGDIIMLDSPLSISSTNSNYYHIQATNEFKLYSKNKKFSITSKSTLYTKNSFEMNDLVRKHYLKHPSFIPKELKKILKRIKGTDAIKIIALYESIITNDKFYYSLTPKNSLTMSNFIKNKVGYCSHYASLLGIILRIKGIPTRLISGFQGGRFNKLGKFYEIKSNDAHVWVEYYSNKSWKRIDPVSFIAPDRILNGTQSFIDKTVSSGERKSNIFNLKFILKSRQYFENLNYRVSLFFDNFDRTMQKTFIKSLTTFFSLKIITIVIIILCLIFYCYYFLLKKYKEKSMHAADFLLRKISKQGLNFNSCQTLDEMKVLCIDFEQSQKDDLFKIINTYGQLRYGRKSDKTKGELKSLINSFLKKYK